MYQLHYEAQRRLQRQTRHWLCPSGVYSNKNRQTNAKQLTEEVLHMWQWEKQCPWGIQEGTVIRPGLT